MNELLLLSIVVSVVINILLFVFLYKKKSEMRANNSFIDSSLPHSHSLFSQALETEISRVERYEEYSFCLASLELDDSPPTLLEELRSFVRKSDSVYIFDKKVYIIFPFLHMDSTFRHKINEQLVEYIRSKHDDIRLLSVAIQECNIHEMISVDNLIKGV